MKINYFVVLFNLMNNYIILQYTNMTNKIINEETIQHYDNIIPNSIQISSLDLEHNSVIININEDTNTSILNNLHEFYTNNIFLIIYFHLMYL